MDNTAGAAVLPEAGVAAVMSQWARLPQERFQTATASAYAATLQVSCCVRQAQKASICQASTANAGLSQNCALQFEMTMPLGNLQNQNL